MAKKKSSSGLVSSAGLMRYFDTEDTAIRISPKAVVIVSVLVGAVVSILNIVYQ
jgi:preprotein translocase subunit Sec61beta